MKTEIYYSFDDEVDIKVGVWHIEKIFAVVLPDGLVVNSNNLVISFKRAEAFQMSEYFLTLSKELNKLKELG